MSDLVIPDVETEEILWMMQAFGHFTMQLVMSGNGEPASLLGELQKKLLEANVETIRTAFLEDDQDDYLAVPKASDEFLDILELMVVNGELRDRRKTIIYEEGEEE